MHFTFYYIAAIIDEDVLEDTRILFLMVNIFCLQAEKMNLLISELAIIAAHERAMLDECKALLASTAAMQVKCKCLTS